MLRVSFDRDRGILCTVSTGFSDAAERDRYLAERHRLTAALRRSGGPVLHLVDSREGALADAADAERMRKLSAESRQPGDRTAIMTGSALTRLQTQRIGLKDNYAFFGNERDAVEWLTSA